MFLAPGLHTNFISPPSIRLSSAPPTIQETQPVIEITKQAYVRSGCQFYIYTHIKEVENSKSIFASRQLTNPFCFPGVHLALPSTIEERASRLERRYYMCTFMKSCAKDTRLLQKKITLD